jgi:hypothetical protein
LFLKIRVCRNANAGPIPLLDRSQQKLLRLSGGEGLDQVFKRAVLASASAPAVLFAAGQALPDDRRSDRVEWYRQPGSQRDLAFEQRGCGNISQAKYLSHKYD